MDTHRGSDLDMWQIKKYKKITTLFFFFALAGQRHTKKHQLCSRYCSTARSTARSTDRSTARVKTWAQGSFFCSDVRLKVTAGQRSAVRQWEDTFTLVYVLWLILLTFTSGICTFSSTSFLSYSKIVLTSVSKTDRREFLRAGSVLVWYNPNSFSFSKFLPINQYLLHNAEISVWKYFLHLKYIQTSTSSTTGQYWIMMNE